MPSPRRLRLISRHGGGHTPPTLALATLIALVALLVLAPAALAAGTYTGGADEYPQYVPNDHTAIAVHLGAEGLEASQTYNIKVRFSPQPAPASTANRGFVWNASAGRWVQEREGGSDWSAFPVVTTDSSGRISGSGGWLYTKFGDVTHSGTYYLLISLKKTGAGSGETLNGTLETPVTVIDMASDGFWVHNGEATSTTGAKRVEANVSTGGTAPFLSLQKTEANGVDDDANGTPDDEVYFTEADKTGSFLMPAPIDTAFNVYLGSQSAPTWTFTGAQSATPDVDIALSTASGADMTPPAAPTSLTVTGSLGKATLNWTASADSDVSFYRIYRWRDSEDTQSTAVKTLVMQVDGATTTYEDTGVLFWGQYYYEVRAVDAATNVSARCTSVRTHTVPTTLTMSTLAVTVDYAETVRLQGTLNGLTTEPARGQVTVEQSTDGSTWSSAGTTSVGRSGAINYDVNPTRKMSYRFVFAGDQVYAASTSSAVRISPRPQALGRPITALTWYRNRSYALTGVLKPHHTVGARNVKLLFYRYENGTWRYRKYAWATNTTYLSYTRYRATTSLPYRGKWRVRAYYPSSSLYAATYSSYRYFTVR